MSRKQTEEHRKGPRKRDYEVSPQEKSNNRRERELSNDSHRRKRTRFENSKGSSNSESNQKRENKWGNAAESDTPKEKKEEFLHRTTNLAISLNHGGDITQPSQMKKKIYFPNDGFNYIGLLIGPKGMFQKKLENDTGWKILIRGRGSKKEGQTKTPEDNDDQHVVIISDKEENLMKGYNELNKIINSDLTTKEIIRNEQLKVGVEWNTNLNQSQTWGGMQFDDSMMTMNGPPNMDDFILIVPNECTGLIIGKKGDKIKFLQSESGAKIKVAKWKLKDRDDRNIFIEGTEEQYRAAKKLIDDIIDEWKEIHQQKNTFNVRNHEEPFQIASVPEFLIEPLTKYSLDKFNISSSVLQKITEKYSVKSYIQPHCDMKTGQRNIEVSGK